MVLLAEVGTFRHGQVLLMHRKNRNQQVLGVHLTRLNRHTSHHIQLQSIEGGQKEYARDMRQGRCETAEDGKPAHEIQKGNPAVLGVKAANRVSKRAQRLEEEKERQKKEWNEACGLDEGRLEVNEERETGRGERGEGEKWVRRCGEECDELRT